MSLGINLLPSKGKICNFDCIYCECGWNADGTLDKKIPSAGEVRSALESKLCECSEGGISIDSITFSGDGEPTLNPDFPQIVKDTIELRNRYYPKAVVSVLSNSTRAHIDEVFQALTLVDNPIMKIDAPTDALAKLVNHPVGTYHVSDIVRALSRFEGNFVLQTMFLRAPGFDSSSPEVLLPWMDIVRELHPREIMVYTLDRPTPADGLSKFSGEEMRSLVQPLIVEGFNIQIKS